MIRTVGDLVAALSKLPQDRPVLVGCHYDNDDGLTNDISVRDTIVAQSEGRFHFEADPSWSGHFQAVVIQ
jgi:hypothetical protein